MGRKLVLAGVTLGDDLPKLVDADPIESAGSLILIEPGHPALLPPLGALSTGLEVPNLMAAQAAAIIGGVASDMHFTYTTHGTIAGKILMERTAKGGIHGIVTQVDGSLAAGSGVLLNAKAGLRAWSGFKVTTGHLLYVSTWMKPTRLPASSANNVVYAEISSGSNSERVMVDRKDGIHTQAYPPIWTTGATSALNVPRRSAIVVDAATETLDNAPTIVGVEWGVPPSTYMNSSPAYRDDAPSFVFYRFYVEDLTVSGRAYSEVAALDGALYTQHVLTAGGRYFGDTFTNPTTIP